jgi:hypothetical protein
MRTVQVDRGQQIARGVIELDRPTLISEIQIGTLPTREPAVPRLRILIKGNAAAESYWRTMPSLPKGGAFQAQYVYPGQKGCLPLLLPAGSIEFRIQARDQSVALVPVEDRVASIWRFE